MLYCYCVALLLFVSSYVLIVCTVPLPPGVNPIAVDKYIYLITNSMYKYHYSYNITVLYMFRALLCSSSGGSIVYVQHLVPSLSLSGRTLHWLREKKYIAKNCASRWPFTKIHFYCTSVLFSQNLNR